MEHVTGLFKHQLDTGANCREFQTQIIRRIREKLEQRIAKEYNTSVERTMEYSDNLEASREEFGMGPQEADSQLIQNLARSQEDLRGRANQEAWTQPPPIVW